MDYDVFISHASEDKESFVEELAENLRGNGLSVWYDDFSLKLGDSLSDSVSRGLKNSKFGIVIISMHFISKRWTNRELAVLIAREDTGEKVILPIWHGVSKKDILDHLPLLADRLAVKSDIGMVAVAKKILEVVGPDRIADRCYKQGFEFEKSGERERARNSYIEALYIDRNHVLASLGIGRVESKEPPGLDKDDVKPVIGRVKFFNAQKGFGFIEDNDGKDYFVHIRTLEREGISSLDTRDYTAMLRRKEGKLGTVVWVCKLVLPFKI